MKRVYLDSEYCYPGMKRGTPRPTAADIRQIVQIAAIIIDTETGEEIASFNQLIKPTYENSLPDFFIELTGITQESVDASSISLDKALSAFVQFTDNLPIWTFDKDEEVLRQNCGYINRAWMFAEPFVSVKALLPSWGINPDEYSSGTLYRAAGLDMSGHVHNALHDVQSMARAIHVFEKER